MKSWLLVFLLLVSIFIHDAQGIRLRKGASVLADGQHSFHQDEQLAGKRSSEGVEEGKVWKSKKGNSGRIRKLTTIHFSSSTTTNAKNDKINDEIKLEAFSSTNKKIGRKEENLPVNSSSLSSSSEAAAAPEPYPDAIDIGGMDYSLQARRRPPIHN